ncbi:hypothetical protein HYW83_00250 [Candidatus Peregrinibacteria bacterium]|nr:hypothetical protein [Candidatus Peregrinibacteria bacterium]
MDRIGKIKRSIKGIPVLYPLAKFLSSPREELKQWKDFFAFKNGFQRIFSVKSKTESRGKLLIVSLHGNSVNAIKEEAFFAKAAQLHGLEPYILTSRGAWANRYYKVFGIDKFIYFEKFFRKLPLQKIRKDAREYAHTIQTFDQLMAFEYEGVKIGKYICSSLVRKTYTGEVDMGNPETRKYIQYYLEETMSNALAAKAIFEMYNPAAVLFLERGYTPYGEFFDIALERGLNVVQWCGSHTDNAFMLKRFHRGLEDQHPASLSEKTWDMLKKMPWTEERSKKIKQELFQNYSSGGWFSEVGTQFNTSMMEKEKIQKMLGLDPKKKTAFIFPHLFWDATFFWGEDIFTNYRDWFIHAVKAACANPHLNWVIKIHPANVVKLNRDGYKGELVEKLTIREVIGELPSHVKLLEPTTKISTFSLYSWIDYCLTVRGTPGIEAAMFGIPVLTAGTGRYDRHGFTIDSSTREDYLEKLSKIHTYPRLTPEQIELAEKFAYGTFLVRPFPFKSIKISYERDKKATPKVNYLLSSTEDLFKAKDLAAFGQWFVDSKDEDYIELSQL